MINDDIFKALKPHIQEITGLRMIIYANSNEKAPNGEYAAIDVYAGTGEFGQADRFDRYIAADRQIETEVRPRVTVSVTVEFYRGKAIDYARKLLQFDKYYPVQNELSKIKFGIRGTSGVLNLSALQSNDVEQRARITLELWGSYSYKFKVNTIEKIPVCAFNEEGKLLQSVLIDGATKL